jgi:hypothetical protein
LLYSTAELQELQLQLNSIFFILLHHGSLVILNFSLILSQLNDIKPFPFVISHTASIVQFGPDRSIQSTFSHVDALFQTASLNVYVCVQLSVNVTYCGLGVSSLSPAS